MSEKENFVFYADWVDIIKAYDKTNAEFASNLAKQIIYYGVTGKMTTDDPIITGMVNSMCAALISKSKNRYKACKTNGQQGGAPKRYDENQIMALHNQGMSDKDIAEKLGCAVRTVQRSIAKHGGDNDEI